MKVQRLLFHPHRSRSRVNKALFESAREVPGLVLRDLYEEYPHFQIDREKEQLALRDFDVTVFQHPFYWYSTPRAHEAVAR